VKLAQHHGQEGALSGRERVQNLPLQIGGDLVVEPLLGVGGDKTLGDRNAPGEADVALDLLAQGPPAERSHAGAKTRVA
jgi:hypothetical protein